MQVTWTSNTHRSDPAYGRSYIVTSWGIVHVGLITQRAQGADKTKVITSFLSTQACFLCVNSVQSTCVLENRMTYLMIYFPTVLLNAK